MIRMKAWAAVLAALVVASSSALAAQTDAAALAETPITLALVTAGLDHPWALQVLPDGRMLVSERPGRLRLVTPDGKISAPIAGVPDVMAFGQGGLLDVLLAPDFAASGLIYFSYAEPRGMMSNATAVARARLTLTADGGALGPVQVIFRQEPAIVSRAHFGSRLVWGRDGSLFITLGERYSQRDSAQDLGTDLGKVVRIMADGSVPPDNPFVGQAGKRPEIWSYGHRNSQGAALHPETGALWMTEHGAKGGDELNVVRAGGNYGWPFVTYGTDYDGTPIGQGTSASGIEEPLYYWKPSIATSGLAFYDGALFPAWRGNVLVGGLAGQTLQRLVLTDGVVSGVEVVLNRARARGVIGDDSMRIRDVRVAPDGSVLVLTDEANGRLLRITPK